MKKRIAALLAGVLAVGLLAGCSGGKKEDDGGKSGEGINWPEKAITFTCPWSAGGDTDFNARALAKHLEKELGVSINIVNTTGGGGSIAAAQLKEEKPDGYNFLVFDSAIALNKASGVTDFGYDAFEPAALYAKSTGEFLVVRKDFPADTVEELIQYSNDNPGDVKFAATTGATSYYVATRLKEFGADFNIVNSGSSSERVASLLGEHIDVSINAMGVVKQYLETGELKVLANLASEVPEAYKDYPLAKDQGVDIAYDLVYNILAPKGTNQAVIEKLSKAIDKVVNENADYAKEIKTSYGQTPFIKTGDEMNSALKDEEDMYMEYSEEFQSAAD